MNAPCALPQRDQVARLSALIRLSLRSLRLGEQPSGLARNLTTFAARELDTEECLLLAAAFFEALPSTDQRDLVEEMFWAIRGVEWPLDERDKKRLAWAWNRADNDVRGEFISALGAAL